MGHHFVLIHGGCHGAWVWTKTADLLQQAGNRATALDLASAGNDTTDANTITSFAQYSKPAVDFVASLPDDEKVNFLVQLISPRLIGLPLFDSITRVFEC